ncbi:hypothetical protein CGRA01v4_10305 [Colletotrichum graminicola]|nr:hypothetical protein CGRA01v4_10305 [Colletotrichum graminicola]
MALWARGVGLLVLCLGCLSHDTTHANSRLWRPVVRASLDDRSTMMMMMAITSMMMMMTTCPPSICLACLVGAGGALVLPEQALRYYLMVLLCSLGRSRGKCLAADGYLISSHGPGTD